MKAINKYRIATNKNTGRRFVVESLSFPTDGTPAKCYCYGGVVKCSSTRNGGARWTHAGIRAFMLDAMDVSEPVPFTFELATELWEEEQEVRAAANGCALHLHTSRTGRTTTPKGVELNAEELLEAAAEAEEAGKLELAAALLKAAEAAEAGRHPVELARAAAKAAREARENDPMFKMVRELVERLANA